MQDWAFWAAAGILVLAVAAILLQSLRRGAPLVAAEAMDIRVYRDQLTEVERDVTRGTLSAEEAQRVRSEVGRRLLEADRRATTAGAQRPGATGGMAAAVSLIALTMAGAVSGYLWLGAPGYPDVPLAKRLAEADASMKNRPSQAGTVARAPKVTPAVPDAEFATLMEKLRTAVAARPSDLVGLELLARNEAGLGNLVAAEAALRQLIAARGEASRAEDHASLAEMLIRAALGYVSPEAEAELIRALEIDPGNGAARYFSGLMFAQGGRYDRTFALWSGLLADGPEDAVWIAPIRAQIAEIADRAGVNYEAPPARGPGADDVAAAAGMAAEDRQAMIEGMVAQLSDRLATEGGPAEDWARLITSLSVLERQDEAQTIYAEAQSRFAGRTVELSFLRQTAVEAGLDTGSGAP